jgi:hypothetical protein
LEDKIANVEKQLKASPTMENIPSQTPSEPAQETSDEDDEDVSAGVLPQPEQSEVEVSPEGSKKRKRNLF